MTAPILVMGNKNYSSWSLRAWLGLRKAGVEFEERLLPLDTPQFYEQIKRLSPAGLVPALRDQDLCVWDSLAILEYVNERWAEHRLLPADASKRALARSVSAEMHSGFALLRQTMPMNCRAIGRRVESNLALEAEIKRVVEIWEDCRALANGEGDWLLGDFSIADAMFVPVALRFNTYGVALGGQAALYLQAVLQDPDVIDWMAAASAEEAVVTADEAGV